MYTFSPYRLDEDGNLWRGGDQVPLTRKAAAVLRCLLAAHGSWRTTGEIMAAVWPDTHVQPENVKVLVSEVRRALDDRPLAPRFIRSARGRGYAFIAPLAEDPPHDGGHRGGPSTPVFVNRGPELAALADALDAARASATRVVFVSGERGSGKTALCEAFLRAAATSGTVRVCHGRCFDQAGRQQSFYPFLDAFARLDSRYPGFVPPILGTHASSLIASSWAASPSADPRETAFSFGELEAVLDVMSHDAPIVLVLEDLQWADGATLDALARVAAGGVRSRLLIVGTCGDGEWLAGTRAKRRLWSAVAASPIALTLRLGPLTLEHVRRYLAARFGLDCVADLAPALHALTGGNPFLMVNAADSLVTSRRLVADADGWRLTAPLDAIEQALPATIGEDVKRSVEELDPAEREAIEGAALVGVDFTASAVSSGLGRSVEQVRTLLDLLSRRGHLIVPAGNRSPRPAHAYRFRHALYAQAIADHVPMVTQVRVNERLDRVRVHAVRRA